MKVTDKRALFIHIAEALLAGFCIAFGDRLANQMFDAWNATKEDKVDAKKSKKKRKKKR